MTDTTHEAPELLPCPFCGGGMSQSKLRIARCRTEGCYMHNFVIDLDSPQSVAAWNTRSNDLVQAAVAAALREAAESLHTFVERKGPHDYRRGHRGYSNGIDACYDAIRKGGE